MTNIADSTFLITGGNRDIGRALVEEALTHQSDELARRRQEMPWVRVEKEYRFETDHGTALTDLFDGRSQLLIHHFMFGPDYKAGCPSCSASAASPDHGGTP